MISRVLVTLLLLFTLSACDNYPRDPQLTLEEIKSSGTLQVAVIEHAPWAYRENGAAAGIEIKLLNAFAGAVNARPIFTFMPMETAVEKIHHGETDIIIGGLTKTNPWRHKIGTTRPYMTTVTYKNGKKKKHHHVIGVPRGENRFIMTLEKFMRSHHGEIAAYYDAETSGEVQP